LTSTSNTVTQTVSKAPTSLSLTVSPSPATIVQSFTLASAITPSAATGTLTFSSGSTTLGTVSLGHGSGSVSVNGFDPGTYTLTVSYGGNQSYLPSSASATQTVTMLSGPASAAPSGGGGMGGRRGSPEEMAAKVAQAKVRI